jgi:hypothetical protein
MHIKKTLPRTRTMFRAQSEKDWVSYIWNSLTSEQKETVSVKGYCGGYVVRDDLVRPMDSHEQAKLPKAVRMGPKF